MGSWAAKCGGDVASAAAASPGFTARDNALAVLLTVALASGQVGSATILSLWAAHHSSAAELQWLHDDAFIDDAFIDDAFDAGQA